MMMESGDDGGQTVEGKKKSFSWEEEATRWQDWRERVAVVGNVAAYTFEMQKERNESIHQKKEREKNRKQTKKPRKGNRRPPTSFESSSKIQGRGVGDTFLRQEPRKRVTRSWWWYKVGRERKSASGRTKVQRYGMRRYVCGQ